MIRVFYGLSGHYPGWFPGDCRYLVSAAGLWRGGSFVARSYPLTHTRMFLDSGGFSFFSRFSDYPFSLDQYVRLARHSYWGYRPLIWAAMDYPCEESINRSMISSNYERIDKTIDNLVYLWRHDDDGSLLPVVQGYTIEERAYCLDKMLSAGIIKSYMGIGSLCVMKSVYEIDYIVSVLTAEFAKYIPGLCWHLFGVKYEYLSRPFLSKEFVFSVDTSAWSLGVTSSKRFVSGLSLRDRFMRYRRKLENAGSSF